MDVGSRQLPSKLSTFITINNTCWIYPPADVEYALSTTTYPYRRVDNRVICPTLDDFINVYTDIVLRTQETQPIGNAGYSLGVGTMLQDLGKEFYFELEGGRLITSWRLTKQLSPQTSPAVATPGDSPPDTIGYVTIFNAYGADVRSVSINLDPMQVVRIG